MLPPLRLAAYMGHSSITVTIDLYGHLMPGSEAEAAGLLDGYLTTQLERETERARVAEPVLTGAALRDSVGDETHNLA